MVREVRVLEHCEVPRCAALSESCLFCCTVTGWLVLLGWCCATVASLACVAGMVLFCCSVAVLAGVAVMMVCGLCMYVCAGGAHNERASVLVGRCGRASV